MRGERIETTMAWSYTQGVMLYVAGNKPISRSEWAEHFADCASIPDEPFKALVWGGDFTPNPEERESIRQTFKGRKLQVAYITSSAWARRVIRVMGVLPGFDVRGFEDTHLPQALAFLGLSPAEQSLAFESLVGLRNRLLRKQAQE